MSAAQKRVGLYLRVSTEDQSCEIQRAELTTYATSRGWKIVGIFEDKATGTNANRANFKALITKARARELDVVLCFKLDRFARSLRDLVTVLQDLAEYGVEFVSMRDHIDLGTSAGRLMAHVIGAMAEFEASLIKERVCSGLQAAKSRGRKLGRPAKINVDQVSQLRREGLSLAAIAKRLDVSKSAVHKTLLKLDSQIRETSGGQDVA